MCLTTKYTLSESTRHSKSKQFTKGLHIFMPGAPVVSAKLYPMALLGGKSSNRLKNLKPFIKVGLIFKYLWFHDEDSLSEFSTGGCEMQELEATRADGQRAWTRR